MPTLVWCLSDIVVIDYLAPIIRKAPTRHNLVVLAVTIKHPLFVNFVCTQSVKASMSLVLGSLITRLGVTSRCQGTDALSD